MRSPATRGAIALALLLPCAARAEVSVDGDGPCLEARALTARLEQVLRASDRTAGLKVEVSARAVESGSEVSLRARTAWGELLLERRYELSPGDCASATELLSLVLDRFLASFPAERWRALQRRAEAAARPRRLELSLAIAPALELAPTGGRLDLSAAVEYGSPRHLLGGSLGARASLPRALGEGHFLELAWRVGLRYRFARFAWQPWFELRAGPALLVGYGYDESYQRVVPCLEAAAGLDRRFRRVGLGLELQVTPLRHRVLTEDQRYSESLPILGLGLRLTLPVRGRNL